MSEEANLTLTVLPILARLGTVPGRVEPTLEDPVCKLAVIPAGASDAASVVGADGGAVAEAAGVTPASLLTGVGEGAVGPVVAAAASATTDFEIVDPEVVSSIRIVRRVVIINKLIVITVIIVGEDEFRKDVEVVDDHVVVGAKGTAAAHNDRRRRSCKEVSTKSVEEKWDG